MLQFIWKLCVFVATVYLVVLCFKKQAIKVSFIYLGIPLLGFAFAFFTHVLVSDLILLKSLYCFYVFSLTGVIAIVLGEKVNN